MCINQSWKNYTLTPNATVFQKIKCIFSCSCWWYLHKIISSVSKCYIKWKPYHMNSAIMVTIRKNLMILIHFRAVFGHKKNVDTIDGQIMTRKYWEFQRKLHYNVLMTAMWCKSLAICVVTSAEVVYWGLWSYFLIIFLWNCWTISTEADAT